MRRALLLSSFLLAGCQSMQVNSDVTRFHNFESADRQKFKVFPRDSSLESKFYSDQISKNLQAIGWRPVSEGEAIQVYYNFSIDNGQVVESEIPLFGQTGGGISTTSGVVSNGYNSASYHGTTYTAPTYGVVGSVPISQTVYSRELNIKMIDRKKGQNVFEATVRSKGSSSTFSAVGPCMIKSVFQNFPGNSGSTEHVELPTNGCSD